MSAGGDKTRGKSTKVKASASQASDRIALVAGGGSIPVMVAKSLSEAGNLPFIAMLEGDADPVLSQYEHMHMSSALIGKLIMQDDVRAYREAGFTDVISKPVERQKLFEQLDAYSQPGT